jgi:integrase
MSNLSQKFVAQLKPPAKDTFHWDSELKGFFVRHWPGGAPIWGVRYRHNGKTKTVVIGPCHEVKAQKARDRAIEIKQSARLGVDLLAPTLKNQPTVADLAREHQLIHAPPKISEHTWTTRRGHWATHILPEIGSVIVSELSRSDVEKLHMKFKNQPSLANRIIATLSKALNDCMTFRPAWRLDNPAARIEKFEENKRTRILSVDEIRAVRSEIDKLKRSNHLWSNVAWLFDGLMLTGLRLSELSKRKWSEVDLEKGTIFIPRTKAKKPRTVSLSSGMIEILNSVPRTNPVWVFPNSDQTGPYLCPQHHWNKLRDDAGVSDVRLHDLRHTVASYAMHHGGLSQREVMELLGHSQMSTTERYLNVHDERKKLISEKASRAILSQAAE